jgi:glycosyltransferase involved in cell wall biosynthesis
MDPTAPKISVVIPTFNAEQYLSQCLSTIAKQEYPNTEVIIVDGKSTDGTATIAARHSIVSRFVSEPDRGQPDAVNKGLRMATGEIVHWHAADDIVLPGAFRRVAYEFGLHPSVDLVFSDGISFDESRVYAGDHVRFINFWTTLLFRGRFQSDCAYWRHRITQSAGPLDCSKPLMCDEDFFLRLWAEHRHRWLPQPLGAFRVREGQVSAVLSSEGLPGDRLDTRNRVLQMLNLSEAEAARLRRRWRTVYLLGTVVAPKVKSAIRYASRRATFDDSRRRYSKWLLDEWIAE